MDRARFHDKAAPEAEGCGFVGDEGNAFGDETPFAQKDQPSFKGGVGVVLVGGGAGAAEGVEIGDLVEDKGAQESEITAGGGKEAVLAVGIPARNAVLEFGRAVEGDFLGALDGPVLEDVIAAGRGVALGGVKGGGH